MRSRTDLTALQLTIVMHIANGMSYKEIAKRIDRSETNVKKHAYNACRRLGVRTLPHLVSVVIASGQLPWDTDQRMISADSADTVSP